MLLHEEIERQLKDVDGAIARIPATSPSPVSDGLLCRWLAQFSPWGKEALVRIAVAVAHEGLRELFGDTKEKTVIAGFRAAERWCLDPTEPRRRKASEASRRCQDELDERNLIGYLDIRELGMAASWAAGGKMVMPPASMEDRAEEWGDQADDCAYEGASYVLELFHENSGEHAYEGSLRLILPLVAEEILPWSRGRSDPIRLRSP